MKRWLRHVGGLAAGLALLVVATGAGGQTCKLELKRLDKSRPTGSRLENMLRAAKSQWFFMQLGGPEKTLPRGSDEGAPEFSEIIKKEPAKYEAEHPFRAVARLGSRYYGFVLDSGPPRRESEDGKSGGEKGSDEKTVEKSHGSKAGSEKGTSPALFTRLYFDCNHNGDLTDDEVAIVDAKSIMVIGDGRTLSRFPRIDLKIEVDGTKVDYAFSMLVKVVSRPDFAYASVRLESAGYREGEITLDGKRYRVVLTDLNSNGVFNDPLDVDEDAQTWNGVVYPSLCDLLYLIDLADSDSIGRSSFPWMGELHYVSKLVKIGNDFYDLEISPGGTELTLSRSDVPVGFVENPNKSYHALVYGDKGFLKIAGDENGMSRLPEGEWRLMEYRIDRTRGNKPETGDGSGQERRRAASSPCAFLSGDATSDYGPIKVTKGKTVRLPFGPPYQAVVAVRSFDPREQVASLELSLVGVAGDVCANLRINDRKPEKPKFTIATADGRVVERGAFEYG